MSALAIRPKPQPIPLEPSPAKAEPPEKLFLVLRVPPREESIRRRVEELVQEMRNSKLDQAKVEQWVHDANFATIPLGTDQDKDNAALMLCYLLCEIIRPEIDDELLNLEDQILEILSIALPPKSDIDAYIADFETYAREANAYQRQKRQVDAVAQKKMDEIASAEEEAGAGWGGIVEGHKTALLESIKEQEEAVDVVHDAVDELGSGVNAARDELLVSAHKMKALGAKLEKEQQHIWRVAAKGRAILDEVRRS